MNGVYMKHRYLKNVVTLSLDDGKCTGCGKCTEVCPHAVFELNEGNAQITDRNLCIECGACAQNCPAAAITVNPGVGCAAAILWGWLTGSEANCGDSGEKCCC